MDSAEATHPLRRLGAECGGAGVILEARTLSKRFGDVQANAAVDLALRVGEIHAILGENGAGKSVLAKTLYGLYRPDAGAIVVDGQQVVLDSPARARALGIGLLFQDFRLVPALSVLRNVALALPDGGFWLRRARLAARIRATARRYGMTVDPSARVGDLSVGERQHVEIVKLVLSGARIMLLDEPTSLLAPQEIDALRSSLRELRDEGRFAIALITHRLDDVWALADRVTVLRGGVVSARFDDVAATGDGELIDAVVGHDLPALRSCAVRAQRARSVLRADRIDVADDRGRLVIRGLSLTVAAGEMVGVAGISGGGQRELAEAVLGVRPTRAGTLEVLGHDVGAGGARRVLEAGAAGISEDPLETDVVPGLTVTHHMALSRLEVPRRGIGYDWQALERRVARLPEAAELGLPVGDRLVTELSGGTVQRVMVVRALAGDPELLVAAYPTRGLDLATARITQKLLLARAAAGAGVLLMSEDLEELFLLSDRIAVLRAGRIVAAVAPGATTRHAVGAQMLGTA